MTKRLDLEMLERIGRTAFPERDGWSLRVERPDGYVVLEGNHRELIFPDAASFFFGRGAKKGVLECAAEGKLTRSRYGRWPSDREAEEAAAARSLERLRPFVGCRSLEEVALVAAVEGE